MAANVPFENARHFKDVSAAFGIAGSLTPSRLAATCEIFPSARARATSHVPARVCPSSSRIEPTRARMERPPTRAPFAHVYFPQSNAENVSGFDLFFGF